jgi:predicted Zn finger-like uncharacterized protein
MDIACPNCAATYRVPDSLLASGKALRCAACDHEWVPEAPPPVSEQPVSEPARDEVAGAAAPAPEAPPAAAPTHGATADVAMADDPAPEPPRAAPARPPPPTTPPPLQRRNPVGPRPAEGRVPARRPINTALLLAWLSSVALVLSIGVALFAFAEPIAAVWPPFERVRALLGE